MCDGFIFHTTDAMAFSNARFGRGSGAILLDNVACTGSEERLINCPYDSHTGDCFHSEDAGIRCPSITRTCGSQDILLFLVCMYCMDVRLLTVVMSFLFSCL